VKSESESCKYATFAAKRLINIAIRHVLYSSEYILEELKKTLFSYR